MARYKARFSMVIEVTTLINVDSSKETVPALLEEVKKFNTNVELPKTWKKKNINMQISKIKKV